MEFKGYFDYRVEVYNAGKKLGTFLYVTNIWFLSIWLNIHPRYWKWTSVRVYHRLTNTFIGEYGRNGNIPSKPVGNP